MENRLIEYGDGVAIVLDKSVIDKLDITFDTPLEVSTHDGVLVIAPVHNVARRIDITEALEWVNQHYGRALKRLAE
ncbi:MAG TPA: AbrB/MazE/SpoVT family DNA-binding domain-containing protein [Chloroflexia bacterium]|nr:AbrB/MazE/SpoVT family DNA-binding domain-containing protein [Chloroflexia bacterium]